jgi:hypothetical protein
MGVLFLTKNEQRLVRNIQVSFRRAAPGDQLLDSVIQLLANIRMFGGQIGLFRWIVI